MTQIYYIWHTVRQGWISKTAGTSTALTDAQEFDRAVAVERCRNSKDHTNTYSMVPVAKDDLL